MPTAHGAKSVGSIRDVQCDRRDEAGQRQESHDQPRAGTVSACRHAGDRDDDKGGGDHGKNDCEHVQHNHVIKRPGRATPTIVAMPAQYIFTTYRLSRRFPPDREVLKDISLSFLPGAKIGVLGYNGAGKSTLLRVMGGRDAGFDGHAQLAPGASVGMLEQEPQLDPHKDVRGNVEDGVAETKALLDRFNELSMNYSEEIADEFARLQERIDAVDGWDLDTTLEIAMDALRCPPPDADVSTLSGGEQRRVALCRLLLSSRTSCFSTSPPTTSTPSRWPGSSAISMSIRGRWWRSPMTATSWTTWRAGSLSSIVAAGCPKGRSPPKRRNRRWEQIRDGNPTAARISRDC